MRFGGGTRKILRTKETGDSDLLLLMKAFERVELVLSGSEAFAVRGAELNTSMRKSLGSTGTQKLENLMLITPQPMFSSPDARTLL